MSVIEKGGEKGKGNNFFSHPVLLIFNFPRSKSFANLGFSSYSSSAPFLATELIGNVSFTSRYIYKEHMGVQ